MSYKMATSCISVLTSEALFPMAIDTLIFDLGGVLIDWNPEYVFREVIPDAERRQYFFDRICTHE